MKVVVAGLGYVGLTTALGFCAVGHTVVSVHSDAARVQALRSRRVPLREPGLEPLLREHLASGRFRAETTYGPEVGACEVAMVAVNTPQTASGTADLQFVAAAARALAGVRQQYQVVVVRSTAPPEALSVIRTAFPESGAVERLDFDVAANPEFLREGHALDDFARPHRIVLGAGSRRAVRLLEDLYRPLVERLESPPQSW